MIIFRNVLTSSVILSGVFLSFQKSDPLFPRRPRGIVRVSNNQILCFQGNLGVSAIEISSFYLGKCVTIYNICQVVTCTCGHSTRFTTEDSVTIEKSLSCFY